MNASHINFKPLSEDTWEDLVDLFEGHGNPGYCWCTLWRIASTKYRELDSTGRKETLHCLVMSGTPTGILGYRDGQPVGWCSIAPRESYPRLTRSKSIPWIADKKTWSVVCFYLARDLRGQDLSLRFLQAAVRHAASQGAQMVEGYPVEPEVDEQGNWLPAKSYRFMGYRSTFERAGFADVTPKGSKRTVMRMEMSPAD